MPQLDGKLLNLLAPLPVQAPGCLPVISPHPCPGAGVLAMEGLSLKVSWAFPGCALDANPAPPPSGLGTVFVLKCLELHLLACKKGQ